MRLDFHIILVLNCLKPDTVKLEFSQHFCSFHIALLTYYLRCCDVVSLSDSQ